MGKLTDEKLLVRQVLSGKRRAFEKLIHKYEALVLHIVSPLIGVDADREDICQDIFIKVYMNLNTFRFNSRLSTWIGNIAYNAGINYLHKKKNILIYEWLSNADPDEISENALLEQRSFGSTLNPEQIFINEEDINILINAIEKLPQLQRSILLLFHQDEMSIQEIGEIMEMPINTVKSHLFRARKTLKELLTSLK